MTVLTVSKDASGERTLTKGLFESKEEGINGNDAVVESVSKSSPDKETEKMAPVTTRLSRATGDEAIPSPGHDSRDGRRASWLP